ncbi:MAG: glycoside hydrolase family 127 protein [Sedimentisphaerales bacterium]|nr:glycoside hydrolase family 127 protein [Sedimentisphaerales bacterium]
MRRTILLLLAWSLTAGNASATTQIDLHRLEPVPLKAVKIVDDFWSPKLAVWRDITVNDAFDKFENTGAFRNFDRVAKGLQERHEGPPWFDGLIYETIRAASDFLAAHPDPALEKRLDGYIERIGAAAARDPNGYVMTFTQLDRPHQRWGLNGGNIVWQHETYDAGAMMEAAVHHVRATGKTSLLEIAVKLANHMCDTLGPAPKKCVIPGHALPEEAFVELYELFRDTPSLKSRLSVPVDEDRYLALAKYWIEDRGRERPGGTQPIGAYSQDHLPVLEQTTIEGHAVRATLCWTGVCAAARHSNQQAYTAAAARVWDNMTGKRMYVTGGVGAHQEEERFGSDYDLPNHGYLETCAAVGAGFFHRNLNLLLGHAKYADELERVLYNNILNGVSLEGTHYYYQNPLAHAGRSRWAWHDCPCCPPMFLKIMSALPGYIYATDSDGLYVNLFVGSQAKLNVGATAISVSQTTKYPWDGKISVAVNPEESATFTVFVRVPGWARGRENPFGLYESDLAKSEVTLKVNGEALSDRDLVRGYAAIKRSWAKGDTITMELPMTVRRIHAHPAAETDRGRVALASGPLIYCLEEIDNPQQLSYYLSDDSRLSLVHKPDLLGGVNVIQGQALSRQAEGAPRQTQLTALPYYCQNNRGEAARIDVWVAEQEQLAAAPGLASSFTASASHCYRQDTVNALNDCLVPAHSNDHSIPRHTWWDHKGRTEWVQYDFDTPRRVSSVAVYWWDDRPARGGCALPQSWRLLYRDDGQWRSVKAKTGYGVEKDRFNEVSFELIETASLRLEAQLQPGYSGGILEWTVR